MYLPGYYTTNYRALRFRELIRMFGWFRLPFTYLKTRVMPPSNPAWMPGLWAENECAKKDLLDRFWQITEMYRQEFRRLGFREVGFSKVTRHLNPTYRDNGGIRYLDESRCHFGLLLYTRVDAPSPVNVDRELITVALTVAFERGSLCYTNNKNAFDPLPRQKVVRLSSASPEPMYQRLRKDIGRRAEHPRHFPNLESLKKWFDEMQDRVFQERAQRGLFLRMSDGEVEAVRRKLPPT